MSRRLDTTPWVREALPPADRAAIEEAIPDGATVSLTCPLRPRPAARGRAARPGIFRARIFRGLDRWEADATTPVDAFSRALVEVPADVV